MADAVCHSVDEVLDSSCDGVRVSADLPDVVQHGCKPTKTLTLTARHIHLICDWIRKNYMNP